MAFEDRFSDVITSEAQLREIIGHPSELVKNKTIHELDAVCRAFIAEAPFLLIASADAQGRMDVSPKGDPPGFVQVLDNTTLLIPDRPGNRRADTFLNILENPRIGLLFLIPGKRETLRVNGEAALIQDADLREPLAVNGKIPKLLLAVNVEEAFFHCPKCIMRSDLWRTHETPDPEDLAFLAKAVRQIGKVDTPVEELQAIIQEDSEKSLY